MRDAERQWRLVAADLTDGGLVVRDGSDEALGGGGGSSSGEEANSHGALIAVLRRKKVLAEG